MIARYGPGASATGVVGWRRDGKSIPLGTDVKLGGRNVASLVFSSGRPARVDSYGAASGEVARWAQGIGIRSSVGVPIRVEGRVVGRHDCLARARGASCRRIPRTGFRASPISPRRRSRTPRHARSFTTSPLSRQHCDGWQRSSPAASLPRSSSPRWPRRSPRCSPASTWLWSAATRRIGQSSLSAAGAAWARRTGSGRP